ncbi:MAG: TldD/PmbA family protein [Syntrophorhabdaceae bacterium]|nr:TldD/PmbA family protein [Syntrophorhabdaceae bacterium]
MFNERRILETLMERAGVYADIYIDERAYTLIQLESGRIEKLERGEDAGVGLRVITPWKGYYASTNSFDESHLADLARQLSRYGEDGSPRTVEIAAGESAAAYCFSIAGDPVGVAVEDKLALVRNFESMARKMEPRIVQARVMYRDTRQSVRIVTSAEGARNDGRTQVVLTVLLVGRDGSEMQTSYEAVGGFYGFEYFTEELMEGLARRTVKRLQGLLAAREAPMGMKTVVIASEAGGTMIHEAIGHGLEADLAMEGLSCYKGLLGSRIASPLVSVVDDATLPHMRGTYAFDDEGVPSQRTVLVEKGVLTNYLFDRFHAMKHSTASTGNGRRESYRFRPIPRMSNTMILPGGDDPQKIVASVDDGILVVKMGGGQVDTVRGDFVFEISEGYMIEKGAVGPMIKNATMMGNGLKVLKDIDMVGTDLGFGIGTCGKDGQGVPVADAQPTLRIPGIIVGGRGG